MVKLVEICVYSKFAFGRLGKLRIFNRQNYQHKSTKEISLNCPECRQFVRILIISKNHPSEKLRFSLIMKCTSQFITFINTDSQLIVKTCTKTLQSLSLKYCKPWNTSGPYLRTFTFKSKNLFLNTVPNILSKLHQRLRRNTRYHASNQHPLIELRTH